MGQAWVAPHPDRVRPEVAEMVADADVERIAVEEATRYETSPTVPASVTESSRAAL